ncbi:peptidylprolyl isomerase [Roseomonas terrae]|uniref:Peptidyl-prolyl cis-trans isomerase n=1 Tax=Neoroseomonas terrae TaxID=424799 RepID=A0ABS5EEK1_9PROT|nr:peptidylprolyl isomerase [Neoroseomonas terrae]MBR0649449.1 peptidylprolyl isomerase [Neoroseomonas terrae]
MDRRTLLGGSIAAFGLAACAQQAPAQTTPAPAPAAPDPENTLILEIPSGTVTIQLLPDLAPNHVARIKQLTRQGFYNNTPFHRVIEGFMAQGGDPTGTGTGGSPLPNLRAEFSPPSRARFLRGTVGMARTADPNSANSQFFIMFAPNQSLDGQYTIWGRVISGMDAVDRIKRGAPGSGTVTNPDRIRTARIATDAR